MNSIERMLVLKKTQELVAANQALVANQSVKLESPEPKEEEPIQHFQKPATPTPELEEESKDCNPENMEEEENEESSEAESVFSLSEEYSSRK